MDKEHAPALLEQHRRLAARLAGRVGRGEAEDLASEAVTRSLLHPAPDGRHAPWTERIFRNLVVDRARRAGRWAAAVSRLSEGVGTPNPEELLLDRERWRALEAAMPTVSPPLRDALVARFYEDRDYDGVAASRGISAATARTRVHRALASLRVSLGRLRACFPTPVAFGTQGMATALLPVVMTAAAAIPSLGFSVHRAAAPVAGERMSHTLVAKARRPSPSSAAVEKPTVAPVAAAAPIPAPAPPPPPKAAPPPRAAIHPPATATATPPGDDATTAVKRFTYEDDDIAGDRDGPDGKRVLGDPRPAAHSSLVEIPRSFLPAIAKMLEDI